MIYVLDSLVYLIAWAFQGFTGFGAGIFIVGILSLYHDPRAVVVSSTLVNLVGVGTIALFLIRKRPDLKNLMTLVSGSVPGILFGTEVLFMLGEDTLRIAIGLFILTLGVYDLTVQTGLLGRWRIKEGPFTGFTFGFLGGFFAGLIGMGGPPPVVYLNQVCRCKDTFKITLTLFFTSNIILRTVFYLREGGLTAFDPMMILPAPITVPLGFTLVFWHHERSGLTP